MVTSIVLFFFLLWSGCSVVEIYEVYHIIADYRFITIFWKNYHFHQHQERLIEAVLERQLK
jgi:hypothetical protein